MAEKKQFYCLRCQHRHMAIHDPKQVVERTCPECRSNSVRLETAAAKAAATRTSAMKRAAGG